MENSFYKRFSKIIRECNYDNTYKMAWAKAIVEICSNSIVYENFLQISLNDIAHKFLKYYWNQSDTQQNSAKLYAPKILSLREEKALNDGENKHRPKEKLHVLPR